MTEIIGEITEPGPVLGETISVPTQSQMVENGRKEPKCGDGVGLSKMGNAFRNYRWLICPSWHFLRPLRSMCWYLDDWGTSHAWFVEATPRGCPCHAPHLIHILRTPGFHSSTSFDIPCFKIRITHFSECIELFLARGRAATADGSILNGLSADWLIITCIAVECNLWQEKGASILFACDVTMRFAALWAVAAYFVAHSQ